MESVTGKFFDNWQRKLVAILSAIVLWFFVDSSITETKSIPNVPIRIINLPADKTITGLLPNRLLSKRVTLNLSGSKDLINEIEPGDLEVLLDVSSADSDEWVVKITKKNLVSLNPSIDLAHNNIQVSHNEFVLKLSPMVTAQIPIKIHNPIGEAPQGYEFLDIWPQRLTQKVSGSEEEIQEMKLEGLELILNLSDITKAELDAIKTQHSNLQDDEISFLVPQKWHKVNMPCKNQVEEINDPEVQNLQIDFLRKSYIPINKEIAIRVFYPLRTEDTLNAKNFPLTTNEYIKESNGIFRMTLPVYARDVSKLFIEIIRDYLEIDIVAAPKKERELLAWSLEVVDPHELEDIYVAHISKGAGKKRENILRKRFREYMQRLALYSAPDQKIHLESVLTSDHVQVTINK